MVILLFLATMPWMQSEDLVDMQQPDSLKVQSPINESHWARLKNDESVLIQDIKSDDNTVKFTSNTTYSDTQGKGDSMILTFRGTSLASGQGLFDIQAIIKKNSN